MARDSGQVLTVSFKAAAGLSVAQGLPGREAKGEGWREGAREAGAGVKRTSLNSSKVVSNGISSRSYSTSCSTSVITRSAAWR